MGNKERNAARAIPTNYNGYKFRSMQEARWALYFDNMNMQYMFEPEGYVLSDGNKYLPDFYLPDFTCFAEVKGGPLNEFDYGRARQLVKDTHIPLIVLDRNPSYTYYEMIVEKDDGEIAIPNVNIVQDPSRSKGKFLTWKCLASREEFIEAGFGQAAEAVKATRGERFGT